MPTPDQFRAARTLLGLTQYRCREMMGISAQAIRDIESIYGKHQPERPYAQYYNLWLREYARMVEPTLRTENRTVINELDLTFPTTADCARWLIEHGHSNGRVENVAQRIRNAINGTASPTYLGFTYHYDNPPQNETTLDI